MPVITIQDYDGYRTSNSQNSRFCPNIITCWTSLAATCNPFVSPRALMFRRLAFLIINGIQIVYIFLAMQRLYLFYYTLRLEVSPLELPWLVGMMLYFFFRAWNLHLIVNLEGGRTVMGKKFSRAWFDGFLRGVAAAYGLLLVWRLVRGPVVDGFVGYSWILLDIVVLVASWISTWAVVVPEDEEV